MKIFLIVLIQKKRLIDWGLSLQMELLVPKSKVKNLDINLNFLYQERIVVI